jgi:hypothetical protein
MIIHRTLGKKGILLRRNGRKVRGSLEEPNQRGHSCELLRGLRLRRAYGLRVPVANGLNEADSLCENHLFAEIIFHLGLRAGRLF